MKNLCLFYDLNHPNVGLLGLFNNVDEDIKKIKSSSSNALYRICAVYSTEIDSLDVVSRLFETAFRVDPDCSTIDGLLHFSVPMNQAVSWLQDLAKLSGTESRLNIFSVVEKTIKAANVEPSNRVSAPNIGFETEQRQSVPKSISPAHPQTTSAGQSFTLTLYDVKASALPEGTTYSQISIVNEHAIKTFLNYKGYGLMDANFVCSVKDHSETEYLFYLPPTTFNVPWVLALNDSVRNKVYVFKIPDNIDLSGRARYSNYSRYSIPTPLTIPTGNINFPCGVNRIELKRFIDEIYDYREILQTHIPDSSSSYGLVSISFLGTDCKVNSWFDVFCNVLDILYSAKPVTFASNLNKFLKGTKISYVKPDGGHIAEYHYVEGAEVWIEVPQSPEDIVSFLKRAFNAFNISPKLLKIEFSGKNPFTNLSSTTNSGGVKVEKKSSSPQNYESKYEAEEAIEISLDKAHDLSGTKPVYFIYNGRKYPVKTWKELLQKIFRFLDNSHPTQLRVLASLRNKIPAFGSRHHPLVLRSKSDRYEQLPTSGIYFITNIGANNAIRLIRYTFSKLNIDSNNLIIAYNDGTSKTNSSAESVPSSSSGTAGMEESYSDSQSKSVIAEYLKRHGHTPRGAYITKVKVSAGFYQFSPRLKIMADDWTLILDDTISKKYYIFEIPKFSINVTVLKWSKKTSKSNTYYTYIRIPYGDTTFTDENSKKISFNKYYKFEINYSAERPIEEQRGFEEIVASTHPREVVKKTDTRVITQDPLSQIPDNFRNHQIVYFEFRGILYEAEHWKDALDEVMDYLYKKNSDVIYMLAYNNVGLDLQSTESKFPFLSLGTDAFSNDDLAHCINGTNIYFRTNYSVTTIINRCIKGLLNLFNEDLDQLVFWYY